MDPNSRTTARRTFPAALFATLTLSTGFAPGFATTISVTTLVDEPLGANGNCTLREALVAANLNEVRDLCPAGQAGVADLIVLPAGVLEWKGVDHLESGIGGPVVVRGPAATPPTAQIEIDPQLAGRFLRFLNGATVTLENVEIRHGDVSEDPTHRFGGAIMALNVSDVDVTLRNVRLDGNIAGQGGALYFQTAPGCDPCRLVIERSVIATNLAASDDVALTPRGGGAYLEIRGETTVRIEDTRFQVNRVSNSFPGNAALGGGLYAVLTDFANVQLRRVVFVGNSAASDATGPSDGGGAFISAESLSSLDVVDATFEQNSLDEPSVADGVFRSTALHLQTSTEASFFVDRMRMFDNDEGDLAVDLRVLHLSTTPSTMRNVLVAGGAGRGARIGNASGDLRLGHITVADHAVEELRLEAGSGELRLENTILWGTLGLFATGAPIIDTTVVNGINPFFEDPAAGDYRLSSISDLIDVGDSGLATVAQYDAGHGTRVFGPQTDPGAYEYGAVFSDDFDSGETTAWSVTRP